MSSFNLNTALATWRRSLSTNRTFSNDDLDELEQHLRDQIAALVRNGATEKAAFEQAMATMGEYGSVEREYEKVYWGKRRRRHQLTDELRWRLSMLKNYLIVALRNLRKHKGYSLINITGLSVGLAACILILLYVQDERSYDRFHENADRLYRVAVDLNTPSGIRPLAQAAPPTGPALANDFPEIEGFTRFTRTTALLARADQPDVRFHESAAAYADSSVFEHFSFALLQGNPHEVLRAPNSIVLSETMARKYFGDADPMGQELTLNTRTPVTVTGIMADLPSNVHYRFEMLLSMETAYTADDEVAHDWGAFFFHTYVLLSPTADLGAVQAKLHDFMVRHTGNDDPYTLVLEPLPDLYLHTSRLGQAGPQGSPRSLYLFSVIAVFILVIACINFMNLATARSMVRAKEVGVRKAIGAQRRQLTLQFLGESVLLAVIAMTLAVVIAQLSLPLFRWLSGKALSEVTLLQPMLLPLLFGGAVVIGLLAGGYPALVLTRFRPVAVLTGSSSAPEQGGRLRKGLVVFQFATSIVLLAGATVVFTQLDFMRTQDLGFEKDQMLVINFNRDAEVVANQNAIKQTLVQRPAVEAATFSSRIPNGANMSAGMQVENADGEMHGAVLYQYFVDFDFLNSYALNLAAGRGFSNAFATDSSAAVILNEAAVRQLGYADVSDVIGKPYAMWGATGTVIGVARDFHVQTLREDVHPLALHIDPSSARYLSLKITTNDWPGVLDDLEAQWTTLVPHRPFDYQFLDEAFEAQYQAEERFGRVFTTFAALAIGIACLGLLGLIAFMAHQRRKEIGVRKVLGASVPSIVALLAKDFLWLVGIAFVVATPVAYVGMQRWLDDFAYHINLPLWVFVLAGGLALGIALLTISYQSIKAALADPVKSLRYE